MPAVVFFPVGKGDMTLLELESGRKILVDINIRSAADHPDEDVPDVAEKLRARLIRDPEGRLYVDAFLLTHPDQDHCRGLTEHFHLGPPNDWSKTDDKILIREIWSSPIVFRRAPSLCDDAKAFTTEARRRVKAFRQDPLLSVAGDRILILGEDEDGKTDDLSDILVKVDRTFSKVDGHEDQTFEAVLLGPLQKTQNQDEERTLAKNHSSTILRWSIAAQGKRDACLFLSGGDAAVAIWERLWSRHQEQPDQLQYDLLLEPHHCSWHSLSYDSWSDKREDAEVCQAARAALSHGRPGANLVASSVPIKDEQPDPPCIRAKREYESIAKEFRGKHRCVGEEGPDDGIEFNIGRNGPRLNSSLPGPAFVVGSGAIGRVPLHHG